MVDFELNGLPAGLVEKLAFRIRRDLSVLEVRIFILNRHPQAGSQIQHFHLNRHPQSSKIRYFENSKMCHFQNIECRLWANQ